MTKLEEKLKKLGYKTLNHIAYYKGIIRIVISRNKILKNTCHLRIDEKVIRNRNDIQKLKDKVDYYHEQLMIMYKDIEELELCQD